MPNSNPIIIETTKLKKFYSSPAGPIWALNGINLKISQGEFLNRKSELRVFVNSKNSTFGDILVEGDVVKIAKGTLLTAFEK